MTEARYRDWEAHRRTAAAEDYAFLINAGVHPEEAATRSGHHPEAAARLALRHPERKP